MMESKYWILEGKKAVSTDDVEVWGEFFENRGKRVLGRTALTNRVTVSTVFVGLFLGPWTLGPDAPPDIFETKVFGGPLDGHQVRYSTWAAAEVGHHAVIGMATRSLGARMRKRRQWEKVFNTGLIYEEDENG